PLRAERPHHRPDAVLAAHLRRRAVGDRPHGDRAALLPTAAARAPRSDGARPAGARTGGLGRMGPGSQRDEQPAVVVVGGEEIAGDRLGVAVARAQLDLLAEPPHAPFERELRRILVFLEAGEPEALDDVGAQEVALAPAGELEDAPADGEDAPIAVAHDEP